MTTAAKQAGRGAGVVAAARQALLVLAPVGLMLGTAAARAQDAPTAQAGKEVAAPHVPHAWNGRILEPNGTMPFGENPSERSGKAERLQAELAQALVALQVERDFDRVAAELDRLWRLAASEQAFPGQADLLVRVALARTELLEAQGYLALAEAATRGLLLDPSDPRWRGLEATLVPASAQLVELAQEAVDDPRLVARRAELAGRSSSGDESLERIVGDALEVQDFALLAEIGAPASAALAREVLARPDEFPTDVDDDPLAVFVRIDQRAAARALLEHVDAGGYAWRRRIVRAMVDGRVLEDAGTWIERSEFSYGLDCLEPEWLELLAALVSRHELELDLVNLLRVVAIRDQLTPQLQAALVARIRTPGFRQGNDVVQILSFDGIVPSARPILEATLEGTNEASLRRFAAEKLLGYADTKALLGLVDDPDPDLRAVCARLLENRSAKIVHVDALGNVDTDRSTIRVTWGEAEKAALVELLRDPDATVRWFAVNALGNGSATLDHAVYAELLRDPSAEVRALLPATVLGLPAEQRRDLLEVLATDSNPRVVALVDQLLSKADLSAEAASWLPALHQRLLATRFEGDALPWNEILLALVRTGKGLPALVRWALDWPGDGLLEQVLFQFARAEGQGQESAVVGALAAVDDADLAALLKRAFTLGSERFAVMNVLLSNASPPRHGALRLVLYDPAADARLRLWTASFLAKSGGADFRNAVLEVLADAHWREVEPTDEDLKTANGVAERLPPAERSALLLAVLEGQDLQPALTQRVLYAYEPTLPNGRELTLLVLERWFSEEGPWYGFVRPALEQLGSMPEDASSELLIRALRHPGYGYAPAAAAAMGVLRRPEFLEPLGRAVEAEWIPDDNSGNRRMLQSAAIQALAGYLDERPVPYLLGGLGSPDALVRDACKAALDRIRDYRERVASWEKLGEAPPTKESATAELVGLLEDEDPRVRAQAARGLATLGAVEVLPRLIRLLQDPDPGVQAAAQEALERLQAPPAKSE